MSADSPMIAAAVLRVAAQLVDGIQEGLARRGFDDVRPAHGFAFARISGSPATAADVAVHLGITKQAAAQLVDHLVGCGYVTREADPRDGRAKLLVLTERGRACTNAAEHASAEVIQRWKSQLSPEQFAELRNALNQIAEPGRLRPTW